MSQTPDIGRVSLEGLSRQELKILAANARQGGRTAPADRAEAELRRRTHAGSSNVGPDPRAGRAKPAPQDMPRNPAPRSMPRWPVGLAAMIALLALIGGGVLLRGRAPAPAPSVDLAFTPRSAVSPPASIARVTDAKAPAPARDGTAPANSTRRPLLSTQRAALDASVQDAPSRAATDLPRLASMRVEAARDDEASAPVLASSGSAEGALLGRQGGDDRLDTPGGRATHRTGYPAPTPARVVVARNMPSLLASGPSGAATGRPR